MPKYQFDVQVQPEYLPEQSSPESGVFGFAYTITITNAGEAPAQLISRHWIIQGPGRGGPAAFAQAGSIVSVHQRMQPARHQRNHAWHVPLRSG